MKSYVFKGLVCLLLTVPSVLFAQTEYFPKQQITEKPLLFSTLPEQFTIHSTELGKLLDAVEGQSLSLKLSDQCTLHAVLQSRVSRSAHLQSINLKLLNYNGALFNLAIDQSGAVPRFTGRILHPQFGDVLLLQFDGKNYQLKKMQQHYFMAE